MNVRRVAQLVQEGVMFKVGRDEYLQDDSIRGYIKFLQDRSTSTVTNHDLNEERARLTHHQANKTEIEEALLNKKVLLKTDVDAEVMGMLGQFRTRLISMPMRVAQVALSAESLHEIEKVCRAEIYAALDELKEGLADYNVKDVGASAQAAAVT
ncbi:hypothetical protein [Oceanicoccus sp.]|uniref:hypothetical protein n=1 Tax=Oceanicoccus sp. TaxID=2691044 RepID=UPI002610E84F|nr:hypothetical protein [Oceanicoccus sp.]